MSVIGHTNALHYLRSGLLSGRLTPSLLFIGKEGIGKKKVAIEVAKSQLCENPQTVKKEGSLLACDSCEACVKVEGLSHPDFLLLNRDVQAILIREKPESQTAIKIEAVRHVDKFLQLKPLEGKRRVVVIDDADLMTNEAANALLKTLEEPPNNGQVILLGRDEHSFPLTIRSRCAVVRLNPIPSAEIARWLNGVHRVEAEVAIEAAGRSGGSFSQALTLKDETAEIVDFSSLALDEFFEALSEPSFRREGRERAEKLLLHLIDRTTEKLEAGALAERARLSVLLRAKKQLERHVAPRLVLENAYLQLNRHAENH